MNTELPKDWKLVKLGEVCKTTTGGTPSRAKSKYYGGSIPWVKSGELNHNVITDTEEKITKAALDNSNAKIFPAGTLLIALYGATIGKLAFLGIDATTNQAVCAIYKSDAVESKYLFNFLHYKKQFLVRQSFGGAQPNISQTILRNLDLPLPPLPEQHRIVAKLEELFSKLEKGKEQLRTALDQLKVYRQAVLKYAFEGKLTRRNRGLNGLKDDTDKNNNLRNPIISEIGDSDNGELPSGWKWVKVKEIADSIQYGYTESSSKEAVGPKFLRITDIQNNSVNWKEVPYCEISNDIKHKYFLSDGDLVFARTGATVGKSFLIKGQIPEAIFASYLIRLRFNKIVLDKYVWNYFQSLHYWRQITDGQVGIGQPNVNGTKLGQLIFPICPLEEQHRIVEEIESRLSVADKLEETITASLQQSETLRQSILKKAFEGKLV